MAIAAMQNNSLEDMQKHLESCYAIINDIALQDESCWPADLTLIEKEERKRLFWSIYTFGIHNAFARGAAICLSEQRCNFTYPCYDDEQLDEIDASDTYFKLRST
ncbi:hypothetical protein PLIIFM63780_002180 [Purpureocillium lilacinum]|nr:hypothetical protein PLIIFM63780_002180 [Purpureocillium lilacinum]